MLQADQIERAPAPRPASWWRTKGAKAKSEFLVAVRASGHQKHFENLAGRAYSTKIDRATHRLKIGAIAWRWCAYMSWRRGLARPPLWVAQALANQLRADAAADLALADALEKEALRAINTSGDSLQKWRAKQAEEREKERAAEAALRVKIESEG